jgi:hypothetical protein
MFMLRSNCSICLAALLIGLVAGCSDGPDVVPVTGTVTRAGKPVGGLMLNFMPEDGRPSWAITDAEGRYELQYSKSYQGGLIGKHKVFVAYEPDQDGRPRALNRDQKAIVAKYGNQSTSPLAVEIKNSGQVVDLQLE